MAEIKEPEKPVSQTYDEASEARATNAIIVSQATVLPAPGWYADPQMPLHYMRWWTGRDWSDYVEDKYAIHCVRCGSNHVFVQQVDAGMDPAFVIIMILLLFIPVIGWIALFCLLISRNKTKTRETCQQCGMTWYVSPRRN
jgi:ribosomal protein L37E